MGRVKGHHIKAAAKYLLKKFPEQFATSELSLIKGKLKELDILNGSKKEQNKLAGEMSVYYKRAQPKVEGVPKTIA